MNYLQELKEIEEKGEESHRIHMRGSQARWIAPPPGDVKCNFGGALSLETRSTERTAIFRARDGSFMGASVLVLEGVVDLKCVEAIACREAMCLGMSCMEVMM